MRYLVRKNNNSNFRKLLIFSVLCLFLNCNVSGQTNNSLDPNATPRYGIATLSENFATDPHTISTTSNGTVDVSLLGLCGGCRGYATAEPDIILNWTGNSNDLRVYFEADDGDKDATLIVYTPDGTWIGNDDAYHGTRNPMIELRGYGHGRYAIWVANYRSDDRIRGTLTITEKNTKPTGENGLALELDVPFVPTTHDVVAAMLDVTNVGPGDYVIDLGSGDGRIVIAAAKRGAFGHGIDLNPVRIREAEENALEAGVSDKVIFIEGDLFQADISKATVLTMYLLSSVNLRLRPIILETLRPGTRVVSHAFTMGDWKADEHKVVDGRNVYYWVVPANAKGNWTWETKGVRFNMDITQEFQVITVNLTAEGSNLVVKKPVLSGERICFTAVDANNENIKYLFSGRIEDGQIIGMAQTRDGSERSLETWTATLLR